MVRNDQLRIGRPSLRAPSQSTPAPSGRTHQPLVTRPPGGASQSTPAEDVREAAAHRLATGVVSDAAPGWATPMLASISWPPS